MLSIDRKHQVYKTILNDEETNTDYFTYTIPEHDEYYFGVGSKLPLQKKALGLIPYQAAEYQAITMVNNPIVLRFMMADFVANEEHYDEQEDSYPNLDLEDVFDRSMELVKTEMTQAFEKLLEDEKTKWGDNEDGYNNIAAQIKSLMKQKLDELDEMRDIQNVNHASTRYSSVTKALLQESAYIPIWVTHSIRTRVISLLRQVADNTYMLVEIAEFVPRDVRKKCVFLHMKSITFNGVVAKAYLDSVQGGK